MFGEIISFIFNLPLYVFAIFLVFYIPAEIILKKSSLPFSSRIIVNWVFGMVMWALQGVIFGYLQVRWLTYFYILIFAFIWVRTQNWQDNRSAVLKTVQKFPFLTYRHLWTILIIFSGAVMQTSRTFFTGFMDKGNIIFCCGENMDSIHHISLINQLVKRFPPYEPGMYGVVVHNYHYWSNLVTAEIVRIFHFSIPQFQYAFMSIFISLALGLSVIAISNYFKLGNSFTRWFLLFVFFGGDAIFLLLFILGKGFNTSMSSLTDGARFLESPPTAYSIIILFVSLLFLAEYIRKKDFVSGVVFALMTGVLVGFKVYTGIFAMIGFSSVAAVYFLRKQYQILIFFAFSVLTALFVYFPVNSSSGGLFFTGFWRFEEFIVQPALGLERFELARYIYQNDQKVIKVLMYDLLYFGIYLFAIFGTKLLALLQSPKSLKKLPYEIHIFFASGIIVSLIIGFFFRQVSGDANTFQFVALVFTLIAFYSALAVVFTLQRISSKRIFFVLAIVIIALTVPRTLYETYMVFKRLASNDWIVLSKGEFEGLKYIKNNSNPNDIVLVDPRGFSMNLHTPYVSYYTDRPTFLSSQKRLWTNNVDFSKREKVIEGIMLSTSSAELKRLLVENSISYFVATPSGSFNVKDLNQVVEKVFQNKEIKIYKTIK